jgi:hypothetical protein
MFGNKGNNQVCFKKIRAKILKEGTFNGLEAEMGEGVYGGRPCVGGGL